jgi:hypothetical protein
MCPPLLNLEETLKRARFTSQGQELYIASIWRFKRFNEVWLHCRGVPQAIEFQVDGFKAQIAVAHDETAAFLGLNCAVTLSKNNDLSWITDWAEYHVQVHGLEGILFFDNNSDKYAAEDIDAALRRVDGLKAIRVVPAPSLYGPSNYTEGRFLQVSLLNIARYRFLSSAAALLHADIDELVGPTPEGSVFTSTKRSLLGYLMFRGRWRYARPAAGRHVRHADCIYGSENDFYPATKYCICPTGPCGFSHWDVHGAVRGFLKNYMVTDRFEYWHCRQISTNWKDARSTELPARLTLAPETARVLDAVYSSPNAELALVNA